MINRFSNVACRLILVVVFVVAGCERGYKEKEETVVYNPLADPNLVLPDYAARAVEASGGLQAWAATKQIQGDCVVTFYKPDNSFYFTEQHHEVHPWPRSIRVAALEPQGKFVWQLSPDGFRVLEGADRARTLSTNVCERYFAEAILDITTAPVRLLDESGRITCEAEAVKVGGLWYHRLIRRSPDRTGIWSEVVFYQNPDTSLVDMIWFADVDKKRFLAVRGYDYRRIGKDAVLVPTKIEIFKTDARGALKERLVKIDYYALRPTE